MSVQPVSGRHSGLRISDADRERAAARLHAALADGRITVSEFEERLTRVYGARYEADLDPPLGDLPSTAEPARPPRARRTRRALLARGAVAAAVVAGITVLDRSLPGEATVQPNPHTVSSTVAVGNGPGGMAVAPDGGLAYVVNVSSDSVSVIAADDG